MSSYSIASTKESALIPTLGKLFAVYVYNAGDESAIIFVEQDENSKIPVR